MMSLVVRSRSFRRAILALGLVASFADLSAQAPASPAAVPGGGGPPPPQPPVVGLPGASNAQNAAVAELNASLAPANQAVTTARLALIGATYGNPSDVAAKAEALRAAEEALALARAEGFAAIQASPNRLDADQIRVLTWQAIRPEGQRPRQAGFGRGAPLPPVTPGEGGDGFAGLGRNNRGGQPQGPDPVRLRDVQLTAVMRLNESPEIHRLTQDARVARRLVISRVYGERLDASAIRASVAALGEAEAKLAAAKAAAFAKFQAESPLKLNPDQVQTLAAWNINARQGL